MRIGLDFDNTIVNYHTVFYTVGREQNLLPLMQDMSKQSVRDYLREQKREDDWTELQGFVYGARMEQAILYPGVAEFIARCVEEGADVFIISHKTRTPYKGVAYDLHSAARSFIEVKGLYEAGIRRDHVFFELTMENKIECIKKQQCDVFLDDLPEFLTHPYFPDIRRYLFAPQNQHEVSPKLTLINSWESFSSALFGSTA